MGALYLGARLVTVKPTFAGIYRVLDIHHASKLTADEKHVEIATSYDIIKKCPL